MNQTEKIPVIETETKQERGDEEENLESTETEEDKVMKIKVTSKEYEIIYELNQSQAAKDLYAQLPLTLRLKHIRIKKRRLMIHGSKSKIK